MPSAAISVAPEVKQIVEITDLFQTGQQQLETALEQDHVLNQVLLERREQVVLVFIDIEWDDGEREQAQQSGIMVREGQLILTAGHGFAIDDGKILEVRVRDASSHESRVEIMELRYDKQKNLVDDWALLRPVRPLSYRKAESLPIVNDRNKTLLLGYPGALGVNSAGNVMRVPETKFGQIYPLGVVCSQNLINRHTLTPRAGAIPIRGISGAPIFDGRGELIGLFSWISRRRNLQGWQYIFGMAEIPWQAIDGVVLK